jgi:Helix-turn-helix domain
MSIRVMSSVFNADLTVVKYHIPATTIPATENRPERMSAEKMGLLSAIDKLVLLALADSAADDGSSIFLSVGSLIHKTCLSERTIQESLRRLEAVGLLVLEHKEYTLPVRSKSTGYTYLRSTRTYRIDTEVLAGLRRPQKGAADAPSTPQAARPEGAPGAPATPQAVHPEGVGGAPESSCNHQEEPAAESNKPSPLRGEGIGAREAVSSPKLPAPPCAVVQAVDEQYQEGFDRFWTVYPKRFSVGAGTKVAVWRVWRSEIQPGPSTTEVILQDLVADREDGVFDAAEAPTPAEWLREWATTPTARMESARCANAFICPVCEVKGMWGMGEQSGNRDSCGACGATQEDFDDLDPAA